MRGRVIVGVLAAVAIGGPLAGPATAAGPGSVDPTFSRDGRATVDFNPRSTGEEARDVAIKINNKVVTVGVVTTVAGSRFAISRLNANGTPDRTFSDDGKRTTVFSGEAAANRVIAMPDGRLLVAGIAGNDFALTRYLANGDLDPTFGGGDGKVVTEVTPGYDAVRDIVITPDGTILAAGFAGGHRSFATVRYLADGVLDPSYADGGVLTTTGTVPAECTINEVRLDSDGRMVVAGEKGQEESRKFLIGRYDDAGNPDTAFGTSGWTTIQEDGEDWGARTLLVQPDGKILAGGFAFYGDYEKFALARVTKKGSLDASFGGGDGTVEHLFANTFYAKIDGLTLQSNGKILAAGWTVDYADQFAVSRYTPTGELDDSFGGDGMVRTRVNVDGYDSRAYAVAVAGGKVVAAGAYLQGQGRQAFGIVRYRSS